MLVVIARSEATKQSILLRGKHGLLRFARNDAQSPGEIAKPCLGNGTAATLDNSGNTATDIRHPHRYINPARHVRAFGVGLESQNDGIDTIERRPRRAPQAAVVPLLASRHPRDGSRSRPLCGLIEVPDPDLYAAVTGDKALPPELARSLFDRIKSFRVVDRDA